MVVLEERGRGECDTGTGHGDQALEDVARWLNMTIDGYITGLDDGTVEEMILTMRRSKQ